MKRIITLILFLAIGITLSATEVSQQQALEKARAFMQQRMGGNSNLRRAPLNVNMQQTETGMQSLYAFNADGGGFVIVSGDDCMDGVLGYSPSGRFESDNMPPALKNLLEQYVAQITRLQQTNRRVAQVSRPHPAISPLLKTDWGQMEPYNSECPTVRDTESGKTYICATGCVATAMAQVLNHHQWPKEGTTLYSTPKGTEVAATTFDWSQMLDNYREQAYNDTQAAAVAHLMSWCGQAVDMSYGLSSGAYSPDIAPALRNCFNCDQGVRQVFRYEVSVDEWCDLIYNELANGRPVIYNGSNSVEEGHCFVCDGYDGYGMYAINWGWYGICNGYYDLDILETVRSGTGGSIVSNRWSLAQDIIIGIQPPVGTPATELPSIHLENTGMYVPYDSIVTRDKQTGSFPPITLAFTYNSNVAKIDIRKKCDFAVGFALTDTDGKMISKLETTSFMPFLYTNIMAEHLRQADVILPNGLDDGTYHIVPWYTTNDNPDKTLLLYDSERRYILLTIKDGKAKFESRPQSHLKFSNPQYQCDEHGNVQQLNITIHNSGPDEYNGLIYLLNDGGLQGYESLYLKADTVNGTKRNILCQLSSLFSVDTPYSIYCDPALFKPAFGEPVKMPKIEAFHISESNVDSVKMAVYGKMIMGNIAISNTGDVPASSIALCAIDSVGNIIINHSVTESLKPGESYKEFFNITLPQNTGRFALMLIYNVGMFKVQRAIVSPILRVVQQPMAINSDYQIMLLDMTNPVMPEGYTALFGNGCQFESITPNSNPNTVYYVDQPALEGLEGHITVNPNNGDVYGDITYYDDRELFQPIKLSSTHDVNYIRTFAEEESGHWSSFTELFLFSSIMAELESITDVNTGEDLSQYFKWYSAGLGRLWEDDASVTPVFTFENDNVVLFRVAPEVAGRTVSFKGSSMAKSAGNKRGAVRTTTSKLELPYFYEIADDQFVLCKNASPQPYRIYLEPTLSEGQSIDSLPATIRIVTSDEMASGIKTIETDDRQSSNSQLYDLQGRRVSDNPQPGIYIIGGKKVIIK